MGKIQTPKRIRTEDYPEEYQDLVGPLSSAVNDYNDATYQLLNNGLDFDNLKRQLSIITVTMSAGGVLVNPPQIKINLSTRIVGINVIRAVNVNSPTTFVTTAPFISYSLNSNLLTILHITGLQAGSQYQLTLELIG